MATIDHKIFGKVECVRSWRARSIRLKVCSDLTLRLTYPIFCTRSRAIAFMESKRAWIEATRQRIGSTPSVSVTDVAQLRRAAHQYLPATLERLAREHNFTYTSLRITSAHTRWGSCSGKNGISLSLFIMLLPEHLREFIILHELCHTRHHNHSASFHALLDSCVGGRERLLNRELKSYHIPTIR